MGKSDLELAYTTIEGIKKMNIPVPEELARKVDVIEKEYIETVVLPALKECAEKAMAPLRTPYTIEVKNLPEEGIQCKIAPQMEINFGESEEAEVEEDSIEEEDSQAETENESESEAENEKRITRGRKTRLCVKFPDGKIIWERQAKDTLIKAIQRIGIERADSVPDILCDGRPLITNHKDDRKELYPLAKGWWICTHSSTLTKMKQLQKISDTLRLGLKVEITEGLLYN